MAFISSCCALWILRISATHAEGIGPWGTANGGGGGGGTGRITDPCCCWGLLLLASSSSCTFHESSEPHACFNTPPNYSLNLPITSSSTSSAQLEIVVIVVMAFDIEKSNCLGNDSVERCTGVTTHKCGNFVNRYVDCIICTPWIPCSSLLHNSNIT